MADRVGQRESFWQFPGHSFRIGATTTAARYGIPDLARPWASAPVIHINSTLEPQWNQVWKFLGGCFSNRYRIRVHKRIHFGAFRVWLRGIGRPRALARQTSLRHVVGTHVSVALLCQPWGRYVNLEAGCQKWKPLNTPGTQPPLSNAVVKCI